LVPTRECRDHWTDMGVDGRWEVCKKLHLRHLETGDQMWDKRLYDVIILKFILDKYVLRWG